MSAPPSPAGGASGRDGQRSRVYAAEAVWRAQLDAARAGARELSVAGSVLVLPQELILGSLPAASAYLRRVEAEPAYRQSFPDAPALRVRARRGAGRAHYEPPDTIALPAPRTGPRWALREAVVLHEVAHHVAGAPLTHGPHFAAALLRLVAITLGDEAAFALWVEYGEHGVASAESSQPPGTMTP